MEKLIILAGSAVINVLFSKGIALGLVLILFWIKGRQLKFNSEEWDNYFLELSQEKVIKIALGIAGKRHCGFRFDKLCDSGQGRISSSISDCSGAFLLQRALVLS